MSVRFTTMKEFSIEGTPLTKLYIDGALVWEKPASITNLFRSNMLYYFSGGAPVISNIPYTYPQVIRICTGTLGSIDEDSGYIEVGGYTYSGESVDPYYTSLIRYEYTDDVFQVVVIDPASATTGVQNRFKTATSFNVCLSALYIPDGHTVTDSDIIITANEPISKYTGALIEEF